MNFIQGKAIVQRIVIVLFLLASLPGQSQTIDQQLMYKPSDIPASECLTLTLEPTVPRKIGDTEKKKFRTKWLEYLQSTQDNLQDDSLFLERDYELLWPGFYKEFKNEIDAAITFCKTGNDSSGLTYKWVPSPIDVQTFLEGLTMVELIRTSLPGGIVDK